MKRTKKIIISAVLTILMILSVMPTVSAKTYDGTKGTIKWVVDESKGTLTIIAKDGKSGEIPDYTAVTPGWMKYSNKIKTVIIRTKITKIGNKAFFGLNKATKIEIGKSVKDIGTLAFGKMTALKSFKVDDGNKYYKASGGILFTADDTQLVAYPAGKAGEEYIIPSNVKKLRSYAFHSNKYITKIKNEGSNLNTISSRAFASCESLKVVHINNGCEVLGAKVFSGSTKLTSVTLPPSIQTINENGKTMFSDPDKMKAMIIHCAVNSKIYNVMNNKGYRIEHKDYTFKCSLNLNGGAIEGDEYIDVVFGKTYSNLPTPEKEGYKFEGWYLNGKKIDSDSVVLTASNHTIKAHYEGEKIIIDLNPNGAVCNISQIEVTYGEPYGALPSLNSNDKVGFIFLGWFDNYDNRVYENDIYNNLDITELTAKWKKIIEVTKGLKIRYKTKNTVTLSWNKQKDIDGYKIYKKADKGEFKLVATVKENKYTTSKLLPKKTYRFRVRAYYVENKNVEFGAYSTAVSRPATYLQKPKLKYTYEKSKSRIKVFWKSTGALKYETYMKRNGKWKKMHIGPERLFRFGYDENKNYAFKIRGYKIVLGHRFYSGYSRVVFSEKN